MPVKESINKKYSSSLISISNPGAQKALERKLKEKVKEWFLFYFYGIT